MCYSPSYYYYYYYYLVVKCSIPFGCKPFIRYMYFKHRLSVGGLTFHFLTDFQKSIYLNFFSAPKEPIITKK